MNPYDDGIGLDEYVDWLIDAGYAIVRIPDYDAWLRRFEPHFVHCQMSAAGLAAAAAARQPDKQVRGSLVPTDRFRSAVQDAKIVPDKDIPHVTPAMIVKYITDLKLLGLL
jgi:fatty acid CoA ligase FadD9